MIPCRVLLIDNDDRSVSAEKADPRGARTLAVVSGGEAVEVVFSFLIADLLRGDWEQGGSAEELQTLVRNLLSGVDLVLLHTSNAIDGDLLEKRVYPEFVGACLELGVPRLGFSGVIARDGTAQTWEGRRRNGATLALDVNATHLQENCRRFVDAFRSASGDPRERFIFAVESVLLPDNSALEILSHFLPLAVSLETALILHGFDATPPDPWWWLSTEDPGVETWNSDSLTCVKANSERFLKDPLLLFRPFIQALSGLFGAAGSLGRLSELIDRLDLGKSMAFRNSLFDNDQPREFLLLAEKVGQAESAGSTAASELSEVLRDRQYLKRAHDQYFQLCKELGCL